MRIDFGEVQKAVDARIEKGILPGAALRVCMDGAPIYEYIHGYSDIEGKRELRRDAVFRLCSMTKPITAVAVLIQQDRGLLNVHDEVRKYLPEFSHRKVGKLLPDGTVVSSGDAAREITIEDLLTHGSGLCSGAVGDAQFARLHREGRTPAEMMPAYARLLLDFSPGTSQQYSALVALDLAVRIVELTSGTDYEAFLRRNICEPLRMRDTGYDISSEKAARMVTMYRLRDDHSGIDRMEMPSAHEGFPIGCVSGATCLTSTLDDYCHFAQMLCDEGVFDGKRILSESAVRAMRTPHYKNGFADMGDFFNWGYAVRVRSAYFPDQTLTPGSYGWSGAYNTHFWVDPARKLTAVYMSNMDNAGGAGAETAFEFERFVMQAVTAADKV